MITDKRDTGVPLTRESIRAALEPAASPPGQDMLWLQDAPPEVLARVRAALPASNVPAAVLVPLIERESGFAVLLTQRAATLKDHAGQISFPGGRIEAGDKDPWHAALREAHEEIGLEAGRVAFAGFLPDHLLGTGFRVTPAVGFVDAGYQLRIAAEEVHDVFEVPLSYILDAGNHRSSLRRVADLMLPVQDIPYGGRLIWGATASMLRAPPAARAAHGFAVSRRGAAAGPPPAPALPALESLLQVMQRLRGADGCPWDRAQSFASIAPYTIEEAYEVADAIARGAHDDLRDELGDLLFQVVFHAQIAAEAGLFDFAAVARGITAKLVRRHPQVFAVAAAGPRTAAEQSVAWEQIKAQERGAAAGALDGVPAAMPALLRAHKLSKRAARVGFDFEQAGQSADKVAEELAEVREAAARHPAASGAAAAAVFEEVGDLLFAAANLARKLEVDAEAALRAANAKFERRFRGMESLAAERGVRFEELSLAEQERLWQEVKRRE